MFLALFYSLLHPLGENSPIESFLKKKPEGGMHHVCIEVQRIGLKYLQMY